MLKMVGDEVAYFEVQLAGSDPDNNQHEISIRGSEQFYLGRNAALCRHHWADLTLSQQHLRIHCVLYEQDPVAGIPPLVYATDVSRYGTFLKKSSQAYASSQGRGIRMTRKSGSFLLDNGDELRLSDKVTLTYRSVDPVEDEKLSPLQQREKEAFASRYLLTGRVLGTGSYGKVLVAIHQETGRQLACKVVDLRRLYQVTPAHLRVRTNNFEQSRKGSAPRMKKRWPTRVRKSFQEFEILKDLSHPNIIAIEKAFYSSNTIYIFQDLISGGDLFSFMEYKGSRLRDVEAAVIVRQILKGIEYLHDHEIVHRDLKPDNILMTSFDDGARIVITDFGHARYLPRSGVQDTSSDKKALRRRMHTLVGTLEYQAPEILKNNGTITDKAYSTPVDLWSIGCITVILLAGEVLFADRNHSTYEQNPRQFVTTLAFKCDLGILDDEDHHVWGQVGSNPKDFIKNLIVLDEGSRMTATEALNHAWFSHNYYADDFDALYERSICDWRPHRKVYRQVERIQSSSPGLNTTSQSETMFSEDVVSHFFSRASQQVSDDSSRKSFTISQRQENTPPPPPIVEEYADTYGDYPSQFEQQLDDANESGYYHHSTQMLHHDSIGNSMGQLTPHPEAAETYTVNGNSVEQDVDRYGFDEDIGEAMYELDQQGNSQGEGIQPRTPEVEVVLQDDNVIHETPKGAKRYLQSPTAPCTPKRMRPL